MLTARRPRCEPNVTLPAISANRVSSPPRPTLMPGWKCVPRCRTMISPALTRWPPNRLTPSRWALESRPFRLDEAPFLCAMSALRLLRCVDAGDQDLRVLLAVAQTAAVTGLVPVVDHVDLRSGRVADDLRRDLVPAHLGRVGNHVVVVDHQDGWQHDAGADGAGKLIDVQDVIDRHFFLPAACAHNRVHPRTLSPSCVPSRPGLPGFGVPTTGSPELTTGILGAHAGTSQAPTLKITRASALGSNSRSLSALRLVFRGPERSGRCRAPGPRWLPGPVRRRWSGPRWPQGPV